MSGSPRRQLLRADDALQQLLRTTERFPEAKAELIAQLGEHHYGELLRAAMTVHTAAEVLEGTEPSTTDHS